MVMHSASAEELFEHSDWLLRLARRLVADPNSAEDIVQQTMDAALRAAPERSRGLRPWLATVATNFARRRRRSESRRASHEGRAASKPELVPSANELVEAKDTLGAVVDELQELDSSLRDVVTLRFLRELNSTQISKRLGIPAGTVRWRLREGLAQLRARLDDRFGSRSQWAGSLLSVLGAERVATATMVGLGPLLLSAVGLVGFGALWWLWPPSELGPGAPVVAMTHDTRNAVDLGTAAGPDQPPDPAPRVAITAAPAQGRRSAPKPHPLPPLQRGEAGAALSVTDAVGRPVEHAAVVWPDALDVQGYSGEAGDATVRLRPPADGAQITIRIEAHGYATSLVLARVAKGHWTELGAIAVARSASLRGRVVDQDRLELAGAKVFVTAADDPEFPELKGECGPDPWTAFAIPECETWPNGTFRLTGVPAMKVRVWAGAPGRLFAFSEPIELTPGSDPPELTLELWPLPDSSLICGIVDQGPGLAAAGARLRLTPIVDGATWPEDHAWRRQPRWINADQDGRFTCPARLGFTYDLLAEDREGEYEAVELRAVTPGTANLQLRLIVR